MVKAKSTDRQTEEKIFNAATAIFEEKGFAAARMQEIADHAGINKSLLHYYFRSKEQLFKAVFQPLMKKMFDKLFSVFMLNIPFEDKICMYYNEHIDILLKNPRLPIFLLYEISHNPDLIKSIGESLPTRQLRDAIYKIHHNELQEWGITKKDMPQLMITIVSLAVFPFAARDMMRIVLSKVAEIRNFNSFMQERKAFSASFVISALKNRKK